MKLFLIVLGLGLTILAGLFVLDTQVTSTWSCTGTLDIGMRELNDRKAAFIERQQQMLLDALREETPPESGLRYYP